MPANAEPVVIEMPMEGGQPARTRVASLFRRMFQHRPRPEQHQQEQMQEFRAEEWLAGDYAENGEEVLDDDVMAKSTVKLEAIFLTVNLVRSPVKVELKDGQWHLNCFSEGTIPYRLELWFGDKMKDSVEKGPGAASESRLKFSTDDELSEGFKLSVVARATQNFTQIISEGKMMAGVQISHLNISPSRDGKSHEAKMESQKILISNFEMDLFEIFGQPHNMPAAGEQSSGSTWINRSQTSFFSATNSDLPGYNRECVVCLSQRRDTLFLPCRHMCLCLPCAESLCLHSDKCPICRQEFRSMLSINDA